MYRFPPFPLLNKSFRTKDQPGGRGNSNSPLKAVSTVVHTSTTSVCGPPLHHSVPLGFTVTTSVCLRQQVVPSAGLEGLMQHYQAAGFSKRSLDSRQPLEDPQQTECIMTDGFASLIGPLSVLSL